MHTKCEYNLNDGLLNIHKKSAGPKAITYVNLHDEMQTNKHLTKTKTIQFSKAE